MATYNLGINAKIHYKVGGVAGGGAWIELTNVKDVTVTKEKDEADVTTRDNDGWEATVGTLKRCEVGFQMQDKDSDAGLTAIADVFHDVTEKIGFQVRNKENGKGIEGDFDITSMTESQPLREAIVYDVTAKLSEFSQLLTES